MVDNWATPLWLQNIFMSEEWFDPCPYNENPIVNGLKIDWKEKTYVNPPYSNPLPWIEKAIEESKKGKIIVLLLNVDTSTTWFAKLNEVGAHFMWFAERLKFSELNSSPRPSMLAILS